MCRHRQFGHSAFENGGAGGGGFDYSNMGDIFSDIFGGGDIFGDLFGGGSRRRNSNGPMRGADVRKSVRITFAESVKGIKKLHEREFERRYHFSSLKYFKRELGLSQKKEPEEENMLRDNVKKYYLEQDYNCAETILRCIDEEYGIGLTEDDFKLVSAFGGGMGCGSSCGALCGAMAALGRLTVNTRAHATDGFKDTCADLVEAFRNKLGNTDCSELVKVYKKDDVRCLETVCLAADVFEEFYNTYIAENKIGKIKEM